MDFQIVSDLHLEFRKKDYKRLIKPSAPILLLLGDICACGDENDYQYYKNFMRFISKKYTYIIHIPGNHEYYTNGKRKITYEFTMQGIDEKLKKFAKTINNMSYLNNNVVKLKLKKKIYVIIGTTLWSHVDMEDRKRIQSVMSDYDDIYFSENGKSRRYNINDMSTLHKNAVQYIKREISKIKPNEIGILITHHKPIKDVVNDLYSPAYESDLAHLIKPPLSLAAHGHTHKKYDKMINGVRVVSNPKGYPHQRTNFNPTFYVRV